MKVTLELHFYQFIMLCPSHNIHFLSFLQAMEILGDMKIFENIPSLIISTMIGMCALEGNSSVAERILYETGPINYSDRIMALTMLHLLIRVCNSI